MACWLLTTCHVSWAFRRSRVTPPVREKYLESPLGRLPLSTQVSAQVASFPRPSPTGPPRAASSPLSPFIGLFLFSLSRKICDYGKGSCRFACLCAECTSCLPSSSCVRARLFSSCQCCRQGWGTQRANGGQAEGSPPKEASFLATAVRGVSPSSL